MLIYLLFGILIAAFVITFGPQSGERLKGKGGSSCATDEVWAAKVNGAEISDTSFRYGILAVTGGNSASGEKARQQRIREKVLDALIVRELLAQAAEDHGFRLSDDEILGRIAKNGEMYILGDQIPGKRIYFVKNEGDSEAHFSSQKLDGYARGLGLGGLDQLLKEQKREFLAQKMKDLVLTAVRVAPDEVRARYLADHDKVDASYVLFSPSMYEETAVVTDKDIAAWAEDHAKELQEQYDRGKDAWKNRPKEVRLRDIFIKKSGADAKARADAALARLKKGEDFAAVAKAVSEDVESAKHGGLLYWRTEETMGKIMGPTVGEAVAKLESAAGKDTSEVLESPEAFHIYQLVDRRSGDIPFDKVKKELAEQAVRAQKEKDAAKADADKALAAAKAGESLDKQFPTEAKGNKPKAQKATAVTRTGNYVSGIGESAELAKALFDTLAPGDLAPTPYLVQDAYVVVKLDKHEKPDLAKFEDERLRLAHDLAQQKAYGVLRDFETHSCQEARAKGQISFDPSYVTYDEAKGKVKSAYQPCSTFSGLDLSMLGDNAPVEIR